MVLVVYCIAYSSGDPSELSQSENVTSTGCMPLIRLDSGVVRAGNGYTKNKIVLPQSEKKPYTELQVYPLLYILHYCVAYK